MIPGTFCPHDFDRACMACINAAIEQARMEEREACLSILRSVTPENPMTVNDCIEAIEARKP